MRFSLRALLIVVALLPMAAITGLNSHAFEWPRSILDSDAPSLVLPDAKDIDKIVVSNSMTPGAERHAVEIEIVDPKQIGRLLDFVKARNSGWWTPWDTFPGGAWSILFKGKNKPLFVIWEGGAWIGGRDFANDKLVNRLRSLKEDERAELFKILGVKAE